MSTALVRADGDATARAHGWADLSLKDRRLRAVAACRDRDVSELYSLLEAWLIARGSKGANVSANTLDAYADGLKEFLAGSSSWSLISPPPDAGAMWVRQLEADGKAPSTVSVRLAAARNLYKALHWCGCWLDRDGNPIRVDPFADVKAARDPVPAHEKRKPYSQSDVDALLFHAQGRIRLLVLLCGHGGLRISEALALRWEDIDLTQRQLTVVKGKGSKRRTVPMGGTLHTELSAIATLHAELAGLAEPDSRGLVLGYGSDDAARAAMKRLCQTAGVLYQGKAVHSLRHYCGTRLYRETGKLERGQKMLGHSSIQTTMIYSHWGEEELAKAVDSW